MATALMGAFDVPALRIMAVALLAGDTSALHVVRAHVFTHQRAPLVRCCICTNCKWVDRCKTYHWVEKVHEQPHLTHAPDFDPYDPQVQVFTRNEGAESADATNGAESSTGGTQAATTEYDVFACDAFTEDRGRWLRLMPDAAFIPT